MRWVLKCVVEGVGRRGWISWTFRVDGGGGEEDWACFGGDEGGTGTDVGRRLVAGSFDRGEEGGSGGPKASGLFTTRPSTGGDDNRCECCLFLLGESSGLVGEGELESNGRFRYGELDTSGLRGVDVAGVGCESGITLGGVCHESDCVRRNGWTLFDGVAFVGAVRGRGRAGVRSMRRWGVSFTLVHWRSDKGAGLEIVAGVFNR